MKINLDHAKLSPSRADQWINCPASVLAQLEYPYETSQAADEGVACHQVAAECLNDPKKSAFDYEDKAIDIRYNTKIIMTKAMVECTQKYIDHVRKFTEEADFFEVEKRVRLTEYVSGGFGTLDAVTFSSETGICHLFDLKTGFTEVEAINNYQLRLYALGFYLENKGLGIKKFKLQIIQPSTYNFGYEEIGISDLLKFGEEVKEASKLALSKNPKRIAGIKQCMWCKAKKDCRAHAESALFATTLADANNKIDVGILTDRQKKIILDNEKLITKAISAIKQDVTEKLKNGGEFYDYGLGEAVTKRKWGDEAENFLVERLGDQAFQQERKLISLAVAKELGITNAEINLIAIKPKGEITLKKGK